MRRVAIRTLLWALCVGALPHISIAQPRISEVFFNPPGSNDVTTIGLEYVEIYGTANFALDNYYFIALENENDAVNSGNPGVIENIFNFTGMTTGSNGYAVVAMKASPYPQLNVPFDILAPANAAQPTPAESLKTLASGGHAYVNRDSGNGYGNGTTSSIGHSGQSAELEGSGATYMLIYVDSMNGGVAPVLNNDLDFGNDGLDALPTGWSILDTIGVGGDGSGEEYARFYSDVVFATGDIAGPPGGIESGADYINTLPTLGEIEYVGRVGPNDQAANWLVTNLTDNAASSYTTALRNYAVSGTHASKTNPEVWVGHTSQPVDFPYGTDITVTLGGPNVNFVIPEPSTIVLAGFGGAIALLVAWRRKLAA